LDLVGNELTFLPAEIGQFKKLEKLSLWSNNFSKEEKEKIKKMVPKGCEIK